MIKLKKCGRLTFGTNTHNARKLIEFSRKVYDLMYERTFRAEDLINAFKVAKGMGTFNVSKEFGLNYESVHKYLTLMSNYGMFEPVQWGEYRISVLGRELYFAVDEETQAEILMQGMIMHYTCMVRGVEVFPYKRIVRFLGDLGGHCSKLELGALFLVANEIEYQDVLSRIRLAREHNTPEMVAGIYHDYFEYGVVSKKDIGLIINKDITRPTLAFETLGLIGKVSQVRDNRVKVFGWYVDANHTINLTEKGREIVSAYTNNIIPVGMVTA